MIDDSVLNFNAHQARKAARMSSNSSSGFGAFLLAMSAISLLLATVAAWITHVIVCIHQAAWVLLAFGCVVVPVGVIHGVGVWLGVF